MTALEPGTRVRVSRSMRPAIVGEVERVEGAKVFVVPEGKSKALPFAAGLVRPLERRPPAPEPITVVPDFTPTEPRAVPRERPPARDEGYLEFVRSHPCMACTSRRLVEAHHWARVRTLAKKVDDYRTVPLCHDCHQEFHDTGSIGPWSAKQTRVWFLIAQNELLVEWAVRGRAA